MSNQTARADKCLQCICANFKNNKLITSQPTWSNTSKLSQLKRSSLLRPRNNSKLLNTLKTVTSIFETQRKCAKDKVANYCHTHLLNSISSVQLIIANSFAHSLDTHSNWVHFQIPVFSLCAQQSMRHLYKIRISKPLKMIFFFYSFLNNY